MLMLVIDEISEIPIGFGMYRAVAVHFHLASRVVVGDLVIVKKDGYCTWYISRSEVRMCSVVDSIRCEYILGPRGCQGHGLFSIR